MSLCDTCAEPGRCCKSLQLGGRDPKVGISTWAGPGEAEKQMAAFGLPFVAIEGRTEGPWTVEHPDSPNCGRAYVQHVWSCPRLLPSGRCGAYEDRPTICRDFKAGSDPLCVYYEPVAA